MHHPHLLTKNEIKEKYDGFARWYDTVEAIPEFFGVRALRKRLARNIRGRTLEVAAGSGKNLQLLPRDVNLVAGDISREMLTIADRKAKKLGIAPLYALLDAENLPFQDNSFDTVISTLSSCTFPDPAQAFREMSRVCRPDGQILLLEHGRSSWRWIGWYQDRRADTHARQMGCQWNRHPVQIAQDAGLQIVNSTTHFFDIFAVIEARPIDTAD
jgi:ubiquinone/menaquinone biosynthesis C-methylase UbiE